MQDRHEDDARRLARVLAVMVKKSGRSHRDLERELGLGSAFLSKILHGKVRLQVAHVVGICHALGIPPFQCFELAFPSDGTPVGLLMQEVRLNLGAARKEETPGLEEMIERIVHQVLEKKA